MKMRKEEYIQEVISRIENKRAKREVEKELSAHIDDRISYYTDAGYDEETSNNKALEHMGDPGKVGIQMAKIHKRNVLKVIAISLLIAFLLTSVVLVFTTPIVAKYYSYKFDKAYNMPTEEGEEGIDAKDYDWFYVARKCGPLMNLVYKINPSLNNLDACHGVYSISELKYGLYYNKPVPKDYVKYCLKYSEKIYNSEYRDSYSNGLYSITVVPVVPDQQTQWKIGWGIDYAQALFIDGQIEESKKIIEDCISLVGDKEDYAVMYWTMKEYFYYVYASTDDQALKDWIVEKENAITKTCKGMKKFNNFFIRHSEIYSNTESLDEFFDGQWAEYKDDYDVAIENITKRINDYIAMYGLDFESKTDGGIAEVTGSKLIGNDDSKESVVKYKFDDRLSFELSVGSPSKCVFYLDGKEYKMVELAQQ
ncbi:MAG: hypothetical protein E7515_08210 [Ruminococcaceae bacterium]|jgi:hypothetical protein|nr:hypothetical protein [Oscillospiraceae bacterium]